MSNVTSSLGRSIQGPYNPRKNFRGTLRTGTHRHVTVFYRIYFFPVFPHCVHKLILFCLFR